jgi:formate-dependent nitrite reductase membrane component NrfD
MASGAAALRIAQHRRGAGDGTGRALDRIGFVASIAELVLMIFLRHRLRQKGVDEAASEAGWTLAFDFGTGVLAAGVPVVHYVQSARNAQRSPRSSLLISLAVLTGGFLLRHILLEAGNASTTRPRGYFRFAGGGAAQGKALR